MHLGPSKSIYISNNIDISFYTLEYIYVIIYKRIKHNIAIKPHIVNFLNRFRITCNSRYFLRSLPRECSSRIVFFFRSDLLRSVVTNGLNNKNQKSVNCQNASIISSIEILHGVSQKFPNFH